jgi:hypothetical protein
MSFAVLNVQDYKTYVGTAKTAGGDTALFWVTLTTHPFLPANAPCMLSSKTLPLSQLMVRLTLLHLEIAAAMGKF